MVHVVPQCVNDNVIIVMANPESILHESRCEMYMQALGASVTTADSSVTSALVQLVATSVGGKISAKGFVQIEIRDLATYNRHLTKSLQVPP